MAALQFLTILPVRRGFTSEQIGRAAAAWFPIVGIIIGLILVGLHYVLHLLLPAGLVNALLLVALVILSGSLHLDGLADTIDGMAGHRTPEQRLEIMSDSRIGGIGAVGLFLFLILEYVALNSIPEKWLPYTLLVAPAVSRWAMVNAIFTYPYAKPAGSGKAFKEGVSWKVFLPATLVALLVAVVLFQVAGLVIIAGAWVTITLAALYFKRSLHGLTGDTYGAINEIATVTVFMVVSALAFNHWLL